MDEQDPWNTEIGERYLFNRAGQGAREVEERHAAGKSKLRRFAEQVLDVRTDERNWRRGAIGEEEVGRRLDQLPRDRWAVVHDLTIGTKGANLDHLVLGPPGVFSINTKHLTGKVTLYHRAIFQNGHETSYVRDSLREARKVQNRLSAAVGRDVPVRGVIVLMGCELDVRGRPSDLSVIGRREVPAWFEKLPGQVLSPGDVLGLERAARTSSTWVSPHPNRPASRPAAPPASEAAHVAMPSEPALGGLELTIRRWRRYGHDRLYASLGDGTKAGWIDVPTGRVEIDLPQHAEAIRACLADERRKVASAAG